MEKAEEQIEKFNSILKLHPVLRKIYQGGSYILRGGIEQRYRELERHEAWKHTLNQIAHICNSSTLYKSLFPNFNEGFVDRLFSFTDIDNLDIEEFESFVNDYLAELEKVEFYYSVRSNILYAASLVTQLFLRLHQDMLFRKDESETLRKVYESLTIKAVYYFCLIEKFNIEAIIGELEKLYITRDQDIPKEGYIQILEKYRKRLPDEDFTTRVQSYNLSPNKFKAALHDDIDLGTSIAGGNLKLFALYDFRSANFPDSSFRSNPNPYSSTECPARGPVQAMFSEVGEKYQSKEKRIEREEEEALREMYDEH